MFSWHLSTFSGLSSFPPLSPQLSSCWTGPSPIFQNFPTVSTLPLSKSLNLCPTYFPTVGFGWKCTRWKIKGVFIYWARCLWCTGQSAALAHSIPVTIWCSRYHLCFTQKKTGSQKSSGTQGRAIDESKSEDLNQSIVVLPAALWSWSLGRAHIPDWGMEEFSHWLTGHLTSDQSLQPFGLLISFL